MQASALRLELHAFQKSIDAFSDLLLVEKRPSQPLQRLHILGRQRQDTPQNHLRLCVAQELRQTPRQDPVCLISRIRLCQRFIRASQRFIELRVVNIRRLLR